MRGHTASLNLTKYISFLIKDDEFLEKYRKSKIKSAIVLKRI